jgi:hypothetical protein
MMLRDLVRACFAEIGIEVDQNTAQAVERRLRQAYGGERVYICSYPKDRARQLAHLAGQNAKKLAADSGISERHARRILRGR